MGEFEDRLKKDLSEERLELALEILNLPVSKIRDLIERKVLEVLDSES